MKEDAYKMLAEHSSDVISRHTPDGVYLYSSPSTTRVLGYTPEELIGTNVFDLFHPDDLDMILGAHHKKIETHEAETSFYRIRTKNGDYKWVETISKIILDPETGSPMEIHAFTRDVTQRKKYEDALEASIHEKEVLLQEIHHRVKNNLSLVSGLLAIQKFSIDNPEFERVATDCELRIKSISLVHEKLYRSFNLSSIDFSDYLLDLFESIQQIYDSERDVRIDLSCNAVNVSINQAIPVALILNELITNSFKYAFQSEKDKLIKMTIKEEEKSIFIHYSDNGMGLPEDFNSENPRSMGFTIVRTLVEQLNARFEIKSSNGTIVDLSFKKREPRELETA